MKLPGASEVIYKGKGGNLKVLAYVQNSLLQS